MHNKETLLKAVYYGVAGTVVMTVFSYLAQIVSIPTADFHGMVSTVLNTTGVGAWMAFFGVGVVLAYVYNTAFRHRLPTHSWMRGAFYGLGVFFVMQLVVMPIFGMGFFSGSVTTTVGMIVGMCVYGATVGYLYEQR
ncbi:hypothetical protein K1X76_12330 [bacterium]|nr:hypothetical protein [bacterium]